MHGTEVIRAMLVAAREIASAGTAMERALADQHVMALAMTVAEMEHTAVRGISPEADEGREELAADIRLCGDMLAMHHRAALEAVLRVERALHDFRVSRSRAATEDA